MPPNIPKSVCCMGNVQWRHFQQDLDASPPTAWCRWNCNSESTVWYCRTGWHTHHLGHHMPKSASWVTDFVNTCVSVVTANDANQSTVTSVLTHRTSPMVYQMQLSNLISFLLHDKTLPDWHMSHTTSTVGLHLNYVTHFAAILWTFKSYCKIWSILDP